MASALLAPRRQVHGIALRSNGCVAWLLLAAAIPRGAAAHWLARSRHRQEVCVSDQQLYVGGDADRATVSRTLADRIVLQVDQTTPADQGVLWDQRERGEDPTLDRDCGLRAGGDHQEATLTLRVLAYAATDIIANCYSRNYRCNKPLPISDRPLITSSCIIN